ncbi:uncharacterized protein BX663DRAFT_308355 [Cokeromyces recurvatus]|uniref:uncharacterized protein n=1 Tax=Cokeromyces recurvatus TaxID=90255 RepID=UPI00222061F2|nr:uncharacterized protein BX663DRAFT_308355 [Cokeromyces recurvatus]KAI7905028.1 hypothetical protein BX663DRAFT_308355 [Cokeromyces recurvatus]
MSNVTSSSSLDATDEASKKITTDGLLHIFNVLSTAASLSFWFFKHFFSFFIQIITFICSPFVWIFSACWYQFVTKPFHLLSYILHVFYPVILFCIAAMCCGIFIGGCAGFAAEAFSSILISATWGQQKQKQQVQEEKNFINNDDEMIKEDVYSSFVHSKNNSIQSLSTFFGTSSITKKKKGKEPLKATRIENWDDSLSSSYSPSIKHTSSPTLIRRMKLSSIASSTRNSWEWDDDDED